MKNLFFGTVSDINITGNNVVIIGTDYTKYIIPIYSVTSITFDNKINVITFKFPEKDWENFGCSSMNFQTSYYSADEIIKKYKQTIGRKN